MSKADKVKRYLAAELLLMSTMTIRRGTSFMWKITEHPDFRTGLLPKEAALIRKKKQEIEDSTEVLHKIERRLRHSSDGWRGLL
jgi:hypothetical protein